jgi:hypothetical protein
VNRFRILAACAVTAMSLSAGAPLSARQGVTAPELKAAFLVNFAKFTTWPADVLPAGTQVLACVSGDNRVADALEELTRAQQIDGRGILVRKLKRDGPLTGCHLLYWSATNDTDSNDLLHAAFKKTILTVSDLPDFAEYGGIAGFFVDGGKMRFAVNPAAAERVHLRISSQLLSLAKIVKDVTNANR